MTCILCDEWNRIGKSVVPCQCTNTKIRPRTTTKYRIVIRFIWLLCFETKVLNCSWKQISGNCRTENLRFAKLNQANESEEVRRKKRTATKKTIVVAMYPQCKYHWLTSWIHFQLFVCVPLNIFILLLQIPRFLWKFSSFFFWNSQFLRGNSSKDRWQHTMKVKLFAAFLAVTIKMGYATFGDL